MSDFIRDYLSELLLLAGVLVAAVIALWPSRRAAAVQQVPAPQPTPAPTPQAAPARPVAPPAPPAPAPIPTPPKTVDPKETKKKSTYSGLTITEGVIILGFAWTLYLFGYVHWGPGLLLGALLGLLTWYSYRDDVTVDPPRFARITVWNRLLPWVIRPRIVFAFKSFPLIEKLEIIDETPEIRAEGTVLIFKDVRCKADPDSTDPEKAKKEAAQSGGSVEVHVGIAIIPDDGRSGDFFKSGKIDPVMKMVHTRLGADIRHRAASMTWEEFTFSKASLSMHLITDLTGYQPTEKVVVNPKTKTPVPDLDPTRPHYKYRVRPRVLPADLEITEYDAENFVNTSLVDRPPDVHGMGIRLKQLGVTDIIPEGELKKVADLKAREKQEKRGEELDFDTELALAQKYIEASRPAAGATPTMTLDQALERVRINRGRAKENVVRSSGNPLLDAAALFGSTQSK